MKKIIYTILITLVFINVSYGQNELFKVVEDMPRFPGCDAGSYREAKDCSQTMVDEFLAKNISYPVSSKQCGIEGTVMVSFVVEKNGELTNFEIKNSIGNECDEESMRVAKMMPNWEPGRQRNKLVRVQSNILVKFGEKEEKRKAKKKRRRRKNKK